MQMGLGVGARKNRTFSTYRVRRMLEALWDKLIPKKKKREREMIPRINAQNYPCGK